MRNLPVSVIIPTYNRSEVLKAAVESVLCQTHRDLEVIVVDDGSTDDTEAMLAAIHDSRLRYHRLDQNAGAPMARNIGASLAKYDLLAFQDSDDRWFPNKLEVQLSYLASHPDCALVYCAFEIHDPVTGSMIKFPFNTFPREELSGDIHKLLLRRNTIDTPTMLIKKETFHAVGGFDPKFPSFQDWDLAIRISQLGRIGYADDILLTSIDTKGGISSGKQNRIKARCMILSKYLDEYDSLGLTNPFVNDLLTYAAKDHLQEYAATMLQQYFPDRSWPASAPCHSTDTDALDHNNIDIYLRKLIVEEATLIRDTVLLLKQLFVYMADAIEQLSDADALHTIDLRIRESLKCLQQLLSLPNQTGCMKETVISCQNTYDTLLGKIGSATGIDDIQEDLLTLGEYLNQLSASSETEITKMQKIAGNRLYMELEALTLAMNQLKKMGLTHILDYGCSIDRAGIIGKCLDNHLCFDDLQIDALNISSEDIELFSSPALYDHIYTDAKEIQEQYEAVLVMNYHDGSTMDGLESHLLQAGHLGKYVFSNILPVSDSSCAVSTLNEAMRIFPRFTKLVDGSHYLFLADTTPFLRAEQTAIYTVTHKPFHCPPDPMYQPIHAGRIQKNDLGYPGDHTGDHISDLNPYINECTALYWIWKNDRHPFVGLHHYRRYFSVWGMEDISDWLPTEAELLHILKDYDIILSFPGYTYPATVEQHYRELFHQSEACNTALQVLRELIADRQPKYLESYDRILQGHTAYMFHLFVTSHKIMNDYCTWLFSFLTDAVHQTNEILGAAGYRDSFDRRAIGFLTERLLSVWLQKQHLRIKHLPIVNGGNS